MSGIVTVSDERAVYRVLPATPQHRGSPAEANALDGFVSDTSSAYRNRSIVRERLHCATRTPSTLEMENSFTGSHYLAVAMQDASEGDEPFELWMGNRKLAEARADTNDNRVHLFVIEEPLHLKGGRKHPARDGGERTTLSYRVDCPASSGGPRPQRGRC